MYIVLSQNNNKMLHTKILAVTGTILVWTPILLTVLTAIVGTIADRKLRLDYLMPAELFPVAFIGALLLLWAAFRAHAKQKLIGWGLGAAIFFLISAQGIAVVSGLASGAAEPTGWVWVLALCCIAFYTLATIIVGITGISFIREISTIRKSSH